MDSNEQIFENLLDRVDELEAKVLQQDRTIIGLQNELIRAGRFNHEDADKKVQGIQILLTRAGEYQGRKTKKHIRVKRG